MNISSNTLFHFTKKRETLESILSNNFWPTLCIEKNNVLKGALSTFAIPMVCFCDIPLGNIEKHMNRYGDYAIGLKFDWGKRHGLNPVWYLTHNSNASKILAEVYEGVDKNVLTKNDGSIRGNKLMYQLCYTKKFSEKVLNEETDKKVTIRYYDEREWRYIPKLFDGEDRLFLTEDENSDKKLKDKVNFKLRSKPLCFTPSDMNYIIVRDESELLYMKRRLEEIKGGYSPQERDLLVTKLLPARRIKYDF